MKRYKTPASGRDVMVFLIVMLALGVVLLVLR